MQLASIGIDPGVTGGVCAIWAAGIAVAPMEVRESGRVDGVWLYKWIKRVCHEYELSPVFYIEKVWGFPGQSAVATFSFGHTLGTIEAAVQILGYEYSLITPMTWKKELGLVSSDKNLDKFEKKQLAVTRAKELFPKVTFLPTSRSSVPHLGMVDAALIAYYGHQRLKSPISLL